MIIKHYIIENKNEVKSFYHAKCKNIKYVEKKIIKTQLKWTEYKIFYVNIIPN